MSYSRTLQWDRLRFNLENITFFRPFHSFPKFHQSSKIQSHKLLFNPEPEHHGKPLLPTFREPYSVKFPRRPLPLNPEALWCRYNSNSNSTLGSIENNTPLTKAQANDLILRLTEDERQALFSALQEYNSNQVKAEYEGQLAATRWRSKFGRPSKLPTLGDVDPTGSYCHLPEDWLKKKYGGGPNNKVQTLTPPITITKQGVQGGIGKRYKHILSEKVPAPTGNQLIHVAFFNAVPFIGFGFLDNFIMICAGDYIDDTLGSMIAISTMAAAALGNTVSDVMGIGSAWYVELAASKIGLKPPKLSPIQLDMKAARRAANLGRALGIVVGCLLGMIPLLFFSKESVNKKESETK